MLFNNKKSSLELSIRAIVIVVLAMTLLGLGLGFIRSQFADITALNVEVQEQVKEQITSQLRTSGEKLSFPSTVQLTRGERKTLTIGVQNTGSSTINFGFIVKWDSGNSDHSSGINTFDSEYNPRYLAAPCSFSLAPSEAAAYGLNIKAPKTAGTDMIIVQVGLAEDTNADGSLSGTECTGTVDSTTNIVTYNYEPTPFATKTSFITVG